MTSNEPMRSIVAHYECLTEESDIEIVEFDYEEKIALQQAYIRLVDTIDMIINSLSYDNEQLAQLMIAFGCQHSFYTRRNFDPKYWNVFGDAMLHLVDDLPLKAFKRYRAKSIWFRFVYFVISHMQLGYTSTKRKRICRRNVKDNKDYR
ncbi:hypothetical protein T01_7798 [Trichinella spiralis]|uniref:Globin family profile domain-containing protein n=1 Tax=Trichinella spiralis TaxID=6334 RepID=A0A0V1BQC3_TRISP|nr:hypothetical protein T01_7798 [Trichinella spiralis]